MPVIQNDIAELTRVMKDYGKVQSEQLQAMAKGKAAELRGEAEALRGRRRLARAAELEDLARDELHDHQLVGCRVEDLEGREVGVVRGIWSTGAPDLLVVETADGREQLIPCAREIMREVDLPAGRIVIDAPPGLLDRD